MNISEPFIKRPVATTLLTIAIALAGGAAFMLLPVSPLPQVDFPTISVAASFPGASPEIMASAVAAPLERQFGHIAGLTEMTSSSYLGTVGITLQFDLTRNIDGAARDVQAAINAARSYLPANLPSNPTWRKVNPADAPIMIIALTSEVLDRGQMYDTASTIIQQRLSQIDGVGQVTVGGSSLPAVRVDVEPAKLNNTGLGMQDVRNAISAANANRPKGAFANEKTTIYISANDQLLKAAYYRPLVVGYTHGAAIRLSDIADVQDSVQDLRAAGFSDGKPSVVVIIFKQPQANIIGTVERVRAALPSLQESVPKQLHMTIALDRTTTIRASVRDVEFTLVASVILVIVVVFLFLREARTTLIPGIAVPISLIGTFGIMYLCNYSLDNLSLMALTISTGFVVDDAIVVIENITRHIEEGKPALEAALLGAREIGFTVLSISISLVAVFTPILMMGGIVGRLFREFAVTLSVAILVSLIVSLTTTPMMCAKLLKPKSEVKHGRFYHVAGNAFDWLLGRYETSLQWVLRHQFLTLCVLIVTFLLNVYLLWVMPKGFFPQQDTGTMMGGAQGTEDISFQAMSGKVSEFIKIIQSDAAVEHVTGFTGGSSSTDTARVFVTLKPLKVRKASVTEVINRLRPKLAQVRGASLFLQASQDLRIGGRMGNAQFQYTVQSDNLQDLNKWGPLLMTQMKKTRGLQDVNSDQRNNGLQAILTYDRNTAARMGISAQTLDSVLYNAFGQAEVSTMYTALNQYYVVMEVAPKFWQSPAGLNDIYLQSSLGGEVPLAAVTKQHMETAPTAVNHSGQFPSVTVSFNLAPGVALGQAVAEINKMEQQMGMPQSVQGSFSGTLQAFQASLANEPFLILTALGAVYIVLGMLYESYVHPITILSTLPSAGVGAALFLLLFHIDLSVIALIGIILLIGIVKKNGILMVDFAIEAERREHKPPQEAIYQACVLRFRPILMTTMAAACGALPLVLSTGTGSELRRPLGVVIVGGLLVSQALTLYTTPVVYLYFDRITIWRQRLGRRPVAQTALFLLLLPSCALLFTGCNFAPRYHTPTVETPAAFKETNDWKLAQPADAQLKGNWWEIFNDPELNRLEAQVAISNQNVIAGLENFLAAREVARQAWAGYFPTVTFSPSYQRSPVIGTNSGGSAVAVATTNSSATAARGFSAFTLPLDASWAPDLWGSIRNTVRESSYAAQATAAQVVNLRLTAQAELAEDYYQLRSQDELIQVYNTSVSNYVQSLELTKTLAGTGIDSDIDVAQANTTLQTATAQATGLAITRAQLEHAIAMLIGRPPSTFSLTLAPVKINAPSVPIGVPSELLQRRPDIAAAERTVAQANAAIGVARAAYFPNLTLNGGAGFQSSTLSTLLNASSFYWSFGATLAENVFDAGRRQAVTRQAWAVYNADVANYRQTTLTAFQQVEDDLAALRLLSQETQQQNRAVEAAQKSLDLAMERYRLGINSYLNVITAQQTLLSNQQTAITLRSQQMTDTVQLIVALGGGWNETELPPGK